MQKFPDTGRLILLLLRQYLFYARMDLFDCGRYFSFHVPIKARFNSLLRYAACAYAAKQLGRCKGVKPILGGLCSQQARMEVLPGGEKRDWMLVAMKYYDLALQLLREALEEQNHWSKQTTAYITTSEDSDPATGGPLADIPVRTRPPKTPDELLAATAILCEIEAMDANGSWANHLAGTKSLLDVAEVGMKPSDGTLDVHDEPKFAGGRKAIFWNFARQDFIAACKPPFYKLYLPFH